MPTITESIKAGVPITYADRQWTEFLFSHLYKGHASPHDDWSQRSQRIDADSCRVTFADESDKTVSVSVSVECQVATETERVRADLKRDLQQFREFLAMHCAKDSCAQS
jgi:hypothetical protein